MPLIFSSLRRRSVTSESSSLTGSSGISQQLEPDSERRARPKKRFSLYSSFFGNPRTYRQSSERPAPAVQLQECSAISTQSIAAPSNDAITAYIVSSVATADSSCVEPLDLLPDNTLSTPSSEETHEVQLDAIKVEREELYLSQLNGENENPPGTINNENRNCNNDQNKIDENDLILIDEENELLQSIIDGSWQKRHGANILKHANDELILDMVPAKRRKHCLFCQEYTYWPNDFEEFMYEKGDFYPEKIGACYCS